MVEKIISFFIVNFFGNLFIINVTSLRFTVKSEKIKLSKKHKQWNIKLNQTNIFFSS